MPPNAFSDDLSVLGTAFASQAPPPIAETPPEERRTWRVQRHFRMARVERQAEERWRKLVAKQQVRIRAATIMVPSEFPPCPDDDASPDATAGAAAAAAAAAAPAAAPLGRVATAIQNELEDRVGQHGLKKSLVAMGEAFDYEIEEGLETSFPPNMVFIGPPGTGKTTFGQRSFNGLATGGVLKGKLVTINGTIDVPAQGQESYLKAKLDEAGEGGMVFIDEVDQLTTSRKGFLSGLLHAMANSHNRKIVFVIAHYPDEIDNFFNKADRGFKSRFDYVNKDGWHYLVKYTADELVQIAEIAMAKMIPRPSFADAAARDAMMAVAHIADDDARFVAEKAMASIKKIYSQRMGALRRADPHAHDSQRNMWTASDIFTACPSAAGPPTGAADSGAAAASASGKAAAPPDASRTQRKRPCAPTPAAEADAPAGAASGSEEPPSDSEEAAPLSKQARPDPAPSKPPAPASSRKRKADDLSAEAEEIVRAIDAVYKINPSSDPIAAWELLKELCKRGQFEEGSAVHEKASQGRLGKHLKGWTIEAIESISARGGDSKTVRFEETKDNKLMIYGLSPLN